MDAFVHDSVTSRVVFGDGALDLVVEEVEGAGYKRLFVVGASDLGPHLDRLLDLLGERAVGRWTDVVMHVPVEVATRAAAASVDCGADALLSLGGGSATGMAKAVALRTGLPIIAVPTTYAGSEMTPIWGQTEGATKTTGRDRRVQPRLVIYDPLLTSSLPANMAAASGVNALAHAVEGLYSPTASPVVVLMAEEAIRALGQALPRIVQGEGDMAARSEAVYGCWLAGSVLGMAGMGVHHKICHVLGGTWDLPHAETHAAVLPYATAFNAEHASRAMRRLERALDAVPGDGPGALWDLCLAIGAPTSLNAVGFPADAVDEAVARVVASGAVNPRPVEPQGVTELLRAAMRGRRPGSSVATDDPTTNGATSRSTSARPSTAPGGLV